jgi:hypothetical protein
MVAMESLLAALDARMYEIADEAVRVEADMRSYSFKTVEERLDVSEYVVRKMIAEGTLETVRPTEGTVRVTALSLRKFLYGSKESSKK